MSSGTDEPAAGDAPAEVDVVVVGAGISGLLVARRLLAAGRRVAVIERGGHLSHADQLRTGRHEVGAPGAAHVHETAAGTPVYPWDYVWGVGGSCLAWSGVSPRLDPSDFALRSNHGIADDWPFGIEELLPHYREAERLLGVAGAPDGDGLPAHPFSPVDEALRDLLAPYGPLPQARPSRPMWDRPACCGAAMCELCPVDARFNVLNGLADVLTHPRLDVRTALVVERVLTEHGRATGVRCRRADRSSVDVRAPIVVLAASGLENPAILLRSALDRPATGRFLYDHAHRTLTVRVRRDVGAGHGASVATGASQAYRDGAFRSRRCAAYVSAYNPGLPPARPLAEAIAAGRAGREARARYQDEHRRTLVLDVLLEDLPRPERRVALSVRRDPHGLPRTAIAYPPPSPYERDGWAAVRDDILRRLSPLGVEAVRDDPGPAGAHMLGTCRMGDGDGAVVDADLRHRDVAGLYVTGGCAFPTYSPAHPTLTIAALALRLADHLVG